MLPSKKILVNGTKNGWRLNPLEAEAGDPPDIIVDIEKAIRKTFIPSSGPLEMKQAKEWTYEMPGASSVGRVAFLSRPFASIAFDFLPVLIEVRRHTLSMTVSELRAPTHKENHLLDISGQRLTIIFAI